MNRQAFFAALRKRDSGVFGTSLSQRQVEGIEALLDAGRGLPLQWMAYILANVMRETGGGMYPIKETVMPYHKNKNPSDAEVIARLDRAFAKGQLTWVKTPYWRGGAFGRGQIQATHDYNYRKFGITNYSDALKLPVSARIAVEGMVEGKFTGKRLSDYTFPQAIHAPSKSNPRRIVNGPDGSDREVAANHIAFVRALEAGGWGEAAPEPVAPPAQEIPTIKGNWLADLVKAILAALKKG